MTNHKLSNKDFYIPSWKLKYLFIGTFNPEYGEDVSYYYGRTRNQFWKLLSLIFPENFDPSRPDFFKLLIKHEIGCVDMIHSIESDFELKGYSDSKLFRKNARRKYNTEIINGLIKANPNLKIYSTWGNGPKLNEWNIELQKLNLEYSSLKSPSMAARVPKGAIKFDFMLNDWSSKIVVL